MITNESEILRGLESRLRDVQGLSEDDLTTMKGNLKEYLGDKDAEVDLEAYRERGQQARERAASEGLSLLERIQARVRTALGHTPEREYVQRLNGLQEHKAIYREMLDSFNELLDQRAVQQQDLARQYVCAQGLFEVCQEHYRKKQERIDSLEVEVKQIEQAAGNRFSLVLHERREQLNHARQEQARVEQETEQAMGRYVQLHGSLEARQGQLEEMRQKSQKLEQQYTALSVCVDKWELQRSLHFNDQGPALIELYELAAVHEHQMRRFARDALGASKPDVLDDTYMMRLEQRGRLPLVDQWHRIRVK